MKGLAGDALDVGHVQGRGRADSVLGNRMDELRDYSKLKTPSLNTKWTKIRALM